MITQESVKLLGELKQTNFGKALKELLDFHERELNNVRKCTSWEDTKARTYALDIIDDIFKFMKEKVEVSNKTRYD
jgi:hypothetical protein